MLSAKVATVKIGNREFEGLHLENGAFGIGVPQIAALFPYFQDSQNQASQTLKRLMGKDFKTTKTKTEFNRNTTLAVGLIDFERVLRKLDRAGDRTLVFLLTLGCTLRCRPKRAKTKGINGVSNQLMSVSLILMESIILKEQTNDY